MIVTSRRDRNSGDAKVAGTSRSPLLRLPMRSEFLRPSKNQELLAPARPDCAWFKSIEQDLRQNASQSSINRQLYPLIKEENLSELPEPPLSTPRELLLSMLYAPFVYYWHQGLPLLTRRTAHIG